MKIEIKNLPGGAADAVPAVARWLQSADANFQPVDNIKICKNISGLVRTCDELLKKFSTGVQPVPTDNRVTAIHFDQPAVVPLQEGWVVDLIPIYVAGERVTISGQTIGPDSYAHLKEEARVTGDFFAVLLLSKFGA